MKPCGPKEGYGWLSPIYGREECPPEGVEWCSFCGAYTSCDEYDNLQPACDCSNYKGGYQVTSELNWNKIGDFLEQFPNKESYIQTRIIVLEDCLEMEYFDAYEENDEAFLKSLRVIDYIIWLKEARASLDNEWKEWGYIPEEVAKGLYGYPDFKWREVWEKAEKIEL